MRVLFWQELFWPYIGGIEVLAKNLLLELQGRGYDVTVVTSHSELDLPDEERHEGIAIHRFPFRAALTDRNMEQLVSARRRVTRLKQAFKPDLVHLNGLGSHVLFDLQTRRAHNAPTVFTQHNLLGRDTVGSDTLLKDMVGSVDWVTGVSNAVLDELRQLLPEITPRSSVIYNGVDVPPQVPEPLPVDAPRLLCLGRLVPQKGFDLALTAFASIVHRFPGARMVIAGDGPERPALERQCTQLGLDDVVEFAGWVAPDRTPELMNRATVVVMPSGWEGLPLVALEAALMGRPVVATRVGGTPEVVVDRETGLLVEPGDSPALAGAMALLLGDPGLAARLGLAARERVRVAFSWEGCVNAYDDLYQRLHHAAIAGGARVARSGETTKQAVTI